MTIMIVNNNVDDMCTISDYVYETSADDEILEFDNPLKALAEARERLIDVAFIDTFLPELSGLELGQYLKELNPYVNLIFTSDGKEKAYDAIRMHASGYLTMPTSEECVKGEMEELRFTELQKNQKRVFAQTFGNFEVFCDGEPITFKYNRTKEVLAVLISNRGAQTTNGEIIACLWEDESEPSKKTSYLRNLRQDLLNTLKELKLENIITKQRGSMAVVTDRIECDLYDYIDNKGHSKYLYTGDYMNQYSWSEYYHSELDET